jgi:ribosomal RNA-processing protein 8
VDTANPLQAFQSNPEVFKTYHDSYKKQMESWPRNPLDQIIRWVKKKLPKDKQIADFGCGEARLALSVPNTVHSFDLFALNERVTACDMSRVPLPDGSVDACVFCLSLMGTDVSKFVAEASRVLKIK